MIKGKEGYRKYKNKAQKYLNDRKKLKELQKEAREKIKDTGSKGPFDKVMNDIKLLFKALTDWNRGNYRKFPTGSIVMIVAAIIYFVSPLDLIPDFILGTGFADDAAVIAFVIKQIHSDLKKYEAWKENKTV